jgi:hypothetical protein
MSRKKTVAIMTALVGLAVALLAGTPGAHAVGVVASITDNPTSNLPAPYTAPLKDRIPAIPPLPVVGDPLSANDIGKTPAELGGCDTIDPFLTVNRQLLSYRCNERYDIKSATMSTTATSFTVSWTMNKPLPAPGALDPVSAANWLILDVRFRTPWMNARRIAGDTLDCKRYAHAGPYLMGKKNLSTGQITPGNNDWMSLWIEMLSDDGAHLRYQHGWSHNDPGSIGNFLTVADPDANAAQGCDAGGNITTVSFPGTAGTPVGFVCPEELTGCANEAKIQSTIPVLSADKKTISITVPFNFGYVDNQLHVYNVPIMQPGQVIWDISATASSLFNCAATPNIAVGTTQVLGPQGVQCALILDWAPWSSYDLGLYPIQAGYAGVAVEALLGPTCPYFQVLEYTPGQARQDKAPWYFNLGKGSSGQDNDVMLNPLYTDKANAVAPLVNYDAGWAAGTTAATSNTLVRPAQGRNGSTACNIAVPEAQKQASSPFQGTS